MKGIRVRNHKRFKIFIIMMLMGTMFFINYFNKNQMLGSFSFLNNKSKTLNLVSTLSVGEIESIKIFDDTIAIWNNSKLSYLNTKGEIILEKKFQFKNPDIVFGKDSIYVMDKDTGDIYILDKEGNTIKRFKLEGSIKNLKEDGDNILIHTDLQETKTMNILDKKGNLIRNNNISNKNILTYNVNNKNTKYIISNLNLREKTPESDIFLYSIDDGKEINNLRFKNQIILFTQFIDDKIIVLTDTKLHLIENGKIIWHKEISDIKTIELIGGKICIIYKNIFEVIDLKGNIESTFTLESDYKKILPYKKYVLLYGNNDILVIKDSKKVLHQRYTDGILDLQTGKSFILVRSMDKIELYKIDSNKKDN